MLREVFRYDAKLGRGVWVRETPGEAELNLLRETPARLVKLWLNFNSTRVRRATEALTIDAFDADAMQRARVRRDQALEIAKQDILAKLQEEREEVRSLEKIVRRGIRVRLGRGDSSDTNRLLLEESREKRAWERIKPQLDRLDLVTASNTALNLAREALAAGDDDTLFALRAEIVDYMRGRGDTGGDLGKGCLLTINQEHSKASATVASALSDLQELETGCYQLEMAINYLIASVQNGDVFAPIPGWKKGDTFTLKLDPIDLSKR
jgi:hypothetical protein